MKYYSAIKRDKVLIYTVIWTNPVSITLNKISWSQKTTYSIISFSENIQNSQSCRQKSRIVVAKNSRDTGMEIAYGNGVSLAKMFRNWAVIVDCTIP